MTAGFPGVEPRFPQANPTLLQTALTNANNAYNLANNYLLGGSLMAGTIQTFGANDTYYFTISSPVSMNVVSVYAQVIGGAGAGNANVSIQTNGEVISPYTNLVANTTGTGSVAATSNFVVNPGNTLTAVVTLSSVASPNTLVIGATVTGVGTAGTLAMAAFAQANNAMNVANNWAGEFLVSLYNEANTIYGTVNSFYGAANSGYGVSNASYVTANAAFTTSNAAYTGSNGAFTTANAAYGAVNSLSTIYFAEMLQLAAPFSTNTNTRYPMIYYAPAQLTVSNVAAVWVSNISAATSGDIQNNFVTFQQGAFGTWGGVNISGYLNANASGTGVITALTNTVINQGNTVYVLLSNGNVTAAKNQGMLILQLTYSYSV